MADCSSWARRAGGLRAFGLGVALAAAATAAVAAPAAQPQAKMRGFYETLLTTMKAGPALGESGRYARLAPIVKRLFDLPWMARLAVGPGWASLSPAQRQQVVRAFGRYVSATYADRFDRYSGEDLQVLGAAPAATGGIIVDTRIVKSDGDPVAIDYLMRRGEEGWQVADVYLDGTISQLATQRSEFSAILRRRGVDGLVAALNDKADLLAGAPLGSRS
jgi:phospholipid transport system substrate-binding protein